MSILRQLGIPSVQTIPKFRSTVPAPTKMIQSTLHPIQPIQQPIQQSIQPIQQSIQQPIQQSIQPIQQHIQQSIQPIQCTHTPTTQCGAVLNQPIKCYIDGSCIANGKKHAHAGYGVVFPEYPDFNMSEKLPGQQQTNNRAEYFAFIKALEQTMQIDPDGTRLLIVYTDSQLLLNSVTKWMKAWKRAGWKKSDGKPLMNVDLLQKIDDSLGRRRVSWHHIRAHTGKTDFNSIHNDKADILAKAGAGTKIDKV